MITPATTAVFDVFVPGRPAPQGSKDYKGHRRNSAGISVPILLESSERVKPWRRRIAEVAALAWRRPVLDEPLGIHCDFVMCRPARTPSKTPPAIKRNGDGDKLTRAVWDGLTGVVVREDCLFVQWSGTKRTAERGEQSGCRIRIWRVT